MSTLLVASSGGHLAQLRRLQPRLPADDFTWVTFDNDQSRSLLTDQSDVLFAPPSTSRDLIGTARDAIFARKLARSRSFDRVVSTGASVAVAFLPLFQIRGVESHYIESATRATGPSLSGRLVARVPAVRLYTQYEAWADQRWKYRGSIFDDFDVRKTTAPTRINRIVVTLGTHEKYQFRRAVERLIAVLPSDAEVLWQVGSTDVSDLPIDARTTVPSHELKQAMADADVVVSHAGTGSALTCFEIGKRPVFIPRRKAHSEHVDEHQLVLATELERRKLAVVTEADELQMTHLQEAAASEVVGLEQQLPFVLQ